MTVAFTAWDYQVTYLELSAVIVALVGVGLATAGTRWAWPFYFVSALLYGWLFLEFDLIGSAILQSIFLVAAVWGWFDWGTTGVQQARRLSTRNRLVVVAAVLLLWLVTFPLLGAMGAAATVLDAFVLVGSVAAQLLMVKGFVESWPAWLVVNAVGTYHYASQGLYFTSGFYFVLLLMAGWGWRQWSRMSSAGDPLPAHAVETAGEVR